MPRLHDSVTYCRTCDQYVAKIDVSECAECSSRICPTCSRATSVDPDCRVCSDKCNATFEARVDGPALEFGYGCETPGCETVCLRKEPFYNRRGGKICGMCKLQEEVYRK